MSVTAGTELPLGPARCARPALRLSCLGTDTDTPRQTGKERGKGQEGHPDPSLTPLERPGAAFAGDQDSTVTLPGAPPRVRAARLPGAAGLRSQPRER